MDPQNPDELLAPDAPIIHLLSLRGNPMIKDMSIDELTAHLDRVRKLASQAPTLSAQLTSEAKAAGKGTNSAAAVRKAKLNALLDL